MDPRAQQLFEAVVDLSPSERAAYLAEACKGNDALSLEVESLIDSYLQAGEFFRDPTITPDHAASLPKTIAHDADGEPMFVSLSEKPGDVIGRYKLLQEIGEGGFGVVFMAEQTEPVKRRVALKIIKLGMDTRERIARFDAERQALAMMDHPNIARVFDAGATATGRLYFVMELVDGRPITQYCDEAKLTIDERLGLFRQVCSAVQHAHQKGIIHRDIKPSNVLVTVIDGKPIPKVIDFGIAKAVNVRLTEKTLFTEFRQVIGTPDYMSPEQATNSTGDIDTRSDVYSLGVLLYELLTGVTPFDFSHQATQAFERIQKVIREDDPPKPSLRMSGETSRETAAQRRSDSRKLESKLRGDLDWIVMKCLEKDRTRRYETAQALGDDLQRCLSNEPVLAGPPSVGYRAWKFYKRNRAATLVAGGFAAIIGITVVVLTVALVYANDQRNYAIEQRDQARRAQGVAQTSITKLGLVFISSLNSTQGTLAQERLLAPLQEYNNHPTVQDLSTLPDEEHTIRKMLSIAFESLDKSDLAVEQYNKLAENASDAAALKATWGKEIAEELYNQATYRESAGDTKSANAILLRTMKYLEDAGEKGTLLHAKAQSSLASTMSQTSPYEAERMLGEAIGVMKMFSSGDQGPLAEALFNLSVIRYLKGEYPLAITTAEEALELRRKWSSEDRVEVVQCLSFLAVLNNRLKNKDNATVDRLFQEAKSIAVTWPPDSSHRLELLRLYTRVPYVTMRSLSSAADVKKELADEIRNAERIVPAGTQDACQAMIVLASIYQQEKNDKERERWLRAACDVCRPHDDWSPDVTSRSKKSLAEFYRQRGRFPEAIAYLKELVGLDTRIMDSKDVTERERLQARTRHPVSTKLLADAEQEFKNLTAPKWQQLVFRPRASIRY